MMNSLAGLPDRPHACIQTIMQAYHDIDPPLDRNIHGKIFELAVGEVLAQREILPLYFQAELRHVPLARFDWLLYHPQQPVSLSCKTNTRERWKQAAYEGMALKNVYPQAINYLVTIEPTPKADNTRMDTSQTIDRFIQATTPEFDEMIKMLAEMEFCAAEMLSPIISGNLVENP